MTEENGIEKGELSFDDVFGEAESKRASRNDEPFTKIRQSDGEDIVPCRECGCRPRIHTANFFNKSKYPNNIYISCGCGECDGKWYPDEASAISAWNAMNSTDIPQKEEENRDICEVSEETSENAEMMVDTTEPV